MKVASADTVSTAYEHIPGGIWVCTPDDFNFLTVYVLREQGDWFEDEIRFLRIALQRDANVVDIGASYGCYALTAAALCSGGRVWAYEPCSTTIEYLRKSVEHNGFRNITLLQAAMSDHSGQGKLRLQGNSEMNSIGDAADGEGSEDIALTTIDTERRERSWPRIDFMKIDAEGHEPQAISGGAVFFTEDSPLVMLEIRKVADFDFSPVQLLGKLGYDMYRYAPALGALVPQEPGKPIDHFQLNVFCCKPDRAAEVSDRGLLILESETDIAPLSPPEEAGRSYLSRFAYKEALHHSWGRTWSTPESDIHRRAIDYYAAAMTPETALSQRWAALRESFALLSDLGGRAPTMPRLVSLARVAAEFGAREKAVAVLKQILNVYYQTQQVVMDEPFLCPSREFEQIPPGNNTAGWLVCAILDAYEKMRAFTSYLLPGATSAVAKEMRRHGFCTPEIERREALVALRTGVPVP